MLLAEDDAEMRWLVAHALRKEGYEVVEVIDGARLQAEITSRILRSGKLDVDLLVSDVRMPGGDGLELAEVLQAASIGVPLILMTGFGDEDTRRRVAALGAVLFDKPFALDELRAAAVRLAPPLR